MACTTPDSETRAAENDPVAADARRAGKGAAPDVGAAPWLGFEIPGGFGATSAGCHPARNPWARASAARMRARGKMPPGTGGKKDPWVHIPATSGLRAELDDPEVPPAAGARWRPPAACVPGGEGHSDRGHPARRERVVGAHPRCDAPTSPDSIFPRVFAVPAAGTVPVRCPCKT